MHRVVSMRLLPLTLLLVVVAVLATTSTIEAYAPPPSTLIRPSSSFKLKSSSLAVQRVAQGSSFYSDNSDRSQYGQLAVATTLFANHPSSQTTTTADDAAATNSSSTTQPTNTTAKQQARNKQLPQKHGRTRQYHGRRTTRPFAELQYDELILLTDYHLGRGAAAESGEKDGEQSAAKEGEMGSHQLHELTRLVSSWSKWVMWSDQRDGRRGQLRRATLKSSPQTTSTTTTTFSLNHSHKSTAAQMAERCLRKIILEKQTGNPRAIVSIDMYHSVIQAWVKTGSHSGLLHASSLLDYMESNIDEELIPSSVKCYVTVLDGWCKSRSKGAEVKAEEMLDRIDGIGGKRRDSSDNDDGTLQDGTSTALDTHNNNNKDVRYYNNVMNRIATSGKSNAGQEAERLLKNLIDQYKRGDKSMAPNRSSFNTVIKAYANTGGKNAARNAKRILNMMENPSSLGLQDISTEIEPDKVSCTSILMAWANSGHGGDGLCEVDAGEKAEQLLERMEGMYRRGNREIRPDTVTYNSVIKVWGKCGHNQAGDRSERLLNMMLCRYEEGDDQVRPDDVTFNSVIHNMAIGNEADSPQKALKLLEQMEESYQSGLIDAKPDVFTYNSVLNAFARSGCPGSAERAEEILNNLENSFDKGIWDVQPDVCSYNIVINAWGNSGEDIGVGKAVALLDKMSARTNEGKASLKPDITTYNSVLHAWSQSTDRNAPVKALGLLELMFRLYESGKKEAQPDVLSFSTVINSFGKSKLPGKAREVRHLLRRMQQLYKDGQDGMQPNIFVYSAVLNACAYTFGSPNEKEEALKIGIETFEELQSSEIEVNHVAYGSFLRICRKLMPEDDDRRRDLIKRTFRQCCSDGQVGSTC
eukprot:g8420.t1 g8420   contig3:53576-56252(-)